MSSPPNRLGAALAFGSATAGGAAMWLGVANATGHREAWDDVAYFRYGLPALAILVAVLGFLVPRHAWLWGVMALVSQAVVLFAAPPVSNLWPLGLLLFVGLSIPFVLSAYVGVYVRSLVTGRPEG